MLTLTRKNDQSIIISPTLDLDPNMKVSELFGQSNIEIRFSKIRQGTVSVSIDAPKTLDLVRSELLD
jgi:sRNA-binding carbon storage regulator CsrA